MSSPRTRRRSLARRHLGVETLEQRAVPAAVPFSVSFSADEFPNVNRSVAYPTPDGFRLIGLANDPLTIDVIGANGQLSGTISLAPPPGYDMQNPERFSD